MSIAESQQAPPLILLGVPPLAGPIAHAANQWFIVEPVRFRVQDPSTRVHGQGWKDSVA